MEDFTNIQDENMGGLQLVRFTPLRFLSTLSPLTFIGGRDWINIYCTPETGKLTEQTADDDNGNFQNVTINCTVPKIRPGIHATLKSYRLQLCIIECTDLNGNLRRVGTSAGQVRLYDQSDSGAAATDPNAYTITFKGKQLDTALFI